MNGHLKRVLILLLIFTFVFQMAGVTSLSRVQAYADTETAETIDVPEADEAEDMTAEEIDTESPGEIETDGENPPDAAEEPAEPETVPEETAEVSVETPADETITVEETEEPAEEAAKAEAPMLKAAGTKAVDAKSEASNGVTVLAFSSDVHNGGKNGGDNSAAIRLGNWIDIVESKEGDIDVMAFGGDMARMMNNDPSGFWDYAQSGMDQLTQKGVDGVYTTGNHEYSYGGNFSLSSYNSGAYASNTTQGQYTVNDEAAEGNNYRIYCLGSESGSQSYTNQISSLTAYLNRVGNDKPIFIITHFPLHALSGRNISGAASLIEVLNNAVTENGQMIIFLWGHNHSVSDSYYDQIYGPGTTLSTDNGSKTIQFYYGAAGCMSDNEYGSGSAYVKGKGLVATITPNRGNATMGFTYYDDQGNDVTESASVRSVEVTVPQAADTVSGYVITIGDMALTANPAGDENRLINNNGAYIYTGLAGVSYTAGTTEVTTDMLWQINPSGNGYTIQSMDGKYLSATYAANGGTTSNPTKGDLFLSDTADVWTLDGSFETWSGDGTKINSTNSGKTLTYYSKTPESGSNQTDINLFTIGSSKTDRAQTSKIIEGEITGETTPVTGLTLDQATATVEAGKTVKLTATVEPSNATNKKVNWSSSDEAIATVSNGTVTGVVEGTATIIAKSADDESITATCEVTVTASTTPRYELATSLEDGGEYLIVNANSGSAYALKNPGGTSGGVSIANTDYKTSVTIQSGNYIETDDTDIIWTASANGSGFNITNNGDYIEGYRSSYSGNSVRSFNPQKYPSQYWTYSSDNYLQHNGGDNTYTLRYSSSSNYFTCATSTSDTYKIYLFKKVTSTAPVDVTGVELDKETATLKVGKTTTLTATVTPSNATNKNVTWRSSDEAVATVDSTGKVTGVAVGTATITVTTADGSFTDTCVVTVEESSGPEYYVIKIGNYIMSCNPEDDRTTNTSGYEYYGLEAVTYDANAAAPYNTLWLLEETDTANGYYIKSASGQYLSASYASNSANAYTGTLTVGDTKDIWVASSGLDTWELEGSYLKSTNASVNPRNADIYLTTRTGDNDTEFFTVGSSSNYKESQLIEPEEIAEPVQVTGVTVSPTTAEITVGKTKQLTADVTPVNADNKAVTWSSSNRAVATVDEDGLVTAVGVGTANVTVTTADGGKTAVCAVTVNPSNDARYELVSSLENGGEYLIVNTNAVGSAYALKNPGGTSDGVSIANTDYKTPVTIESGSYILTSDEDIVWTATSNGSGFNLTNNGDYLEGASNAVRSCNPQKYSARYWEYNSSKQLRHINPSSTSSYYTLRYSSSNYFTGNTTTTTGTVYLFKKAGTDPVSGVTLSQETLNLETGETATLTATVLPPSAANKDVTWTTSNDAVATVENGVVTAVGTGNATITVTTVDGGKTATCTVLVTAPQPKRYYEVTGLTEGKDYIVAVTKDANTVYAIKNNSGALATGQLTVTSSGTAYIETADASVVWKYNGGDTKYLTNQTQYYLDISTSGNDRPLVINTSGKYGVGLDGSYVYLRNYAQSENKYYIVFNNGVFAAGDKNSTSDAATIRLFEEGEAPVHTHTYGEPEYDWATDNSTCTATATCSGCEEGTDGHSVTETVNAAYAVTTAATCTAVGSGTYTATFTKEPFTAQTKVVEIPVVSHTLIHHEAVAATCTENGTVEYWSCSVCSKNFSDAAGTTELESTVAPATGHDMTHHDAVAPTCTAAGTVEYWSCSKCSKNFSDEDGTTELTSIVDPATGHDMTHHDAVPATCTAAGTVEYWSCAKCSKNFSDEDGTTELTSIVDPATGHDMTHHDAVPATCTAAGTVEYWSCAKCSKNFSDQDGTTELTSIVDPIKEHTIVIDAAVEATCTETGLTEGSHCSVCGTTLVAQEVVPMKQHTVVTDAAVEATCTSTGLTEGSHCSVCDTVIVAQEVVPMKDHTPGAATHENEVAATCTAEGHYDEVVKCSVCSTEISRTSKTTPALGHDWNEPTYAWADDNSSVTATRTCKNDPSHPETETVETTYSVVTPATETTAGTGRYTATFTNNAFETQTKDITIQPTGYTVSYEWTEVSDGYSVTGTAVPYDTSAQTITETVSATYAVTTEATCTEVGVGTWTASFEKSQFSTQTKEVGIPAKGHTMTYHAAVPATCSAAGTLEYYSCSVCNKNFADEDGENELASIVDPQKDHTPGTAVHENEVEATCTAEGSYDEVVYCSVCNAEISRTPKTVPAKGHNWGEPTYEWAEDNSTVKATRVCGNDSAHNEIQTVNTTYVVVTAATETEAGLGRYTATFTNPAFATQTKEVPIPPTGFEVSYVWADDFSSVTGTAVPYDTSAQTITETVTPQYSIKTEATCTGKGVGTWTATFTKAPLTTQTKDVDIPANGHTEVTDAAVAPTCTETGLTAGSHCSVCNEVIVAQEVVPALGHNLAAHAAVAATCTAAGNSAYWSCYRCGKYFSDAEGTTEIAENSWITEALGHDYTATVTAPTCTERGYTTHTCSRCGDSYVDTYVDALGHKLTAHAAVAATCTAAGNSAYWSCDRCGKYFSDAQGTNEIAENSWITEALGHDYTATVTAPTCTERGYTTHTCSRCGDSYVDTYVDALGHDWEQPTGEWNADHTSVVMTFVCSRDAEHKKTETVTGSAITSTITTEPTATTPGVKTYTATVTLDGKTYTVTDTEAIPATGSTVSGNITSYVGRTEEGQVTVQLFAGDSTEPAYTATVTNNETYSFAGVAAGTYTMKVSKKDHVTRTYEITADGTALTQDVKIHLKGDVNGDGRLTTGDVARTNSHVKEIQFLAGYEFECADIDGNGRLTTGDVAKINSHVKEVQFLW